MNAVMFLFFFFSSKSRHRGFSRVSGAWESVKGPGVEFSSWYRRCAVASQAQKKKKKKKKKTPVSYKKKKQQKKKKKK
eukprot:NODE_30453_length_418_cov_0.817869.p1 GENE.NODE_30453_length_418_cov_0.817869~~NODE_30453_length_418_cov_0.817869.p1  ORF type:complete len:78 (-),score=31.45 NODE_30453_length_418_cov_0.817869:118-351(-)